MIWSVWLLCWAGWWISTVTSVNIERQEANIAADSPATQLARFRYGRQGVLQYTIDHYASTSDGGTGFLTNTTIVLTTEDSWASYLQGVRQHKQDICSTWQQSLTATAAVPLANLTEMPDHTFMRPVYGVNDYMLVLMSCSQQPIQITSTILMVNELNGGYTHLAYGLFQLPWVHLGFAAGVWPLLCLVWAVHLFRNRTVDRAPVYHMLLGLPVFRLLLSMILCVSAFQLSTRGYIHPALAVFDALLRLASSLLLYSAQLFISKGWCITRRRMLRLEQRTVWGTALFAAVADVFYAAVGEGSVLAVGTLQAVMFMYLWLNFRHQQTVLTAHLYRLHVERAPQEVMHAYIRKALMLFFAQRVVVTFGLLAIAVNFFTTYLLGGSSVAYVAHLTPELTGAISLAWLGWIFRLRKVPPVDLSRNAEMENLDDDHDGTNWQLLDPMMTGGTLHPISTGQQLGDGVAGVAGGGDSGAPSAPTAPTNAFMDAPAVTGIGATAARQRIFRRLLRRPDP